MDGAASTPAFLDVQRSLGGRIWRARLADDRLAIAMAQRCAIAEPLARVLAGRGVSIDDAPAYLAPKLRALLPDPSRFKDMDRAAARIADAIERGEVVAIFGDYDVDGATSAALLAGVITGAGGRVRVYIPDRIKEGYGPNRQAMALLHGEGARVVVTVDCGTLAFAPLEAAAELGLEVVVVDHHIAEPRLPAAFAVINPNRLDEPGGFGQLAAVGVAFLLAVAVHRELRRRGRWRDGAEPDLLAALDLVALGTVCDVVPLTGLNRAFVRQGLAVMARRGRQGLAALADVAKLGAAPSAYHLGFMLGPRVNAGGRVGQSDLGVRLLSTADADEARRIAARLDELNRERQAIEQAVLEQAMARVDPDSPFLLVAGEGWHPGVIGIVASRLAERWQRPAAVVALDGPRGKGSGRSSGGFDLGAAIIAARQSGLLVDGGGHPQAAGFTVEAERLPEVTHFLSARCAEALGERPAARELAVDGTLAAGGVTVELAELIQAAGPFGSGNPLPCFVLRDMRVVRADIVGTRHVRCILADPTGVRLSAIAFRAVESELGTALLSRDGAPLHLAGVIEADEWNGSRRARFEIRDAARAA